MTISQDRTARHSRRVGRRIINYNRAYGRLVGTEVGPGLPEAKRKRVRILAEYDLFGDISTDLWEKEFLESAEKRIDIVDAIKSVLVLTGAFGLRRVVFFVDANLVVGEEEFMKDEAYEILCDIVREQDVRVCFLAPLS